MHHGNWTTQKNCRGSQYIYTYIPKEAIIAKFSFVQLIHNMREYADNLVDFLMINGIGVRAHPPD